MAALFPQYERNLTSGSIEILIETLKKVHSACDDFDIGAINMLMKYISSFKWDSEIIHEKIQEIVIEMENLEYGEMSAKVNVLLEMLKDKD